MHSGLTSQQYHERHQQAEPKRYLGQLELVEQIGHKLGIKIPSYQGAAVINYENGHEVNIEFSGLSNLVTLHSGFNGVSASSIDARRMQDILRLNSRIDILHGGWIGIHQHTNSLRYFIAIPLQFALPDLVITLMNNIHHVKAEIIKTYFH